MGFIKLYRSIKDWSWADSPNTVALWVRILIDANWEDKKWHDIIIPRGSFVTSISKLAEETGLSVKETRIALDRLLEGGEVGKQTTNKYTIITVCKYEDYQSSDDDENLDDGKQRANRGQTKGKQRATTKEEEEGKNINNIFNNNTCTYAHEDSFQESWKYVSSVRRSALNNDKDKIAEYKADVFRRQTYEIVNEVGMTKDQAEAFIRWWTEHSPGSDTIKAEYEATFDIKSRATNWVERNKPRKVAEKKGLVEHTKDEYQKFLDSLNNGFNG